MFVYRLCLQKLIIDNCGCFYTRNARLDNFTKPCLNSSESKCVKAQLSTFKIDAKCGEQCPLECYKVLYETQATSLLFPSESFFRILQKDSSFSSSPNVTIENMKQTLVSLKIYYSFTQYTLITESPKTGMFDLFSQVGGTLQIFLGFSIFHLIEIFEIIFVLMFSLKL